MVSKSYRAYVEGRDGEFDLEVTSMCDICGGKSDTWEYGIPQLCSDHARELGLLW